MKIEIEANDINRLSHTAMASFFKEQAERFESTTYKGVEFDEIQDGRMSFWTEGYLNAVIIYNWFTAKGYRCAILQQKIMTMLFGLIRIVESTLI